VIQVYMVAWSGLQRIAKSKRLKGFAIVAAVPNWGVGTVGLPEMAARP
jgi:hypothetical protein